MTETLQLNIWIIQRATVQIINGTKGERLCCGRDVVPPKKDEAHKLASSFSKANQIHKGLMTLHYVLQAKLVSM